MRNLETDRENAGFRIGRFSGRFTDPKRETEFQEADFRGNARRFIPFLCIGIVATPLFLFNDVLLVSSLRDITLNMTVRALLVFTWIGVVFALLRARTAHTVTIAATVAMASIVIFELFIDATRPPDYFGHLGIDLILIFFFYTVVPVPLRVQVVMTGTLTLLLIGLHVIYKDAIGTLYQVAVPLSLIVANAIAYVAALQINVLRRSQYAQTKLLPGALTSLELAKQELMQSETKYRKLVDVCPEGILIHSMGVLRYANPACLDMFGLTNVEGAANVPILKFVHPSFHETARDRIANALATGATMPILEEQFLKLDGSSFWAESTGCSIEFGGEASILLIFRDSTSRRLLEAKLRQSQKLESVGTLAAGIAHDFNNILQAILGYSQLGQEIANDNGNLRECLEEIEKGGRRAVDLVDQILTFSRNTDVEVEPLKLQPLVEDALKFIRSTVPATILIDSNIDADCAQVAANVTQIHQVVTNLCTNAMHAMEDQGGAIRVSLAPCALDAPLETLCGRIEAGQYIQLTVDDTGTGIGPESIHQILDPFFTTKDVSKGTGLGLATVHGIVTGMGGGLTIESELGIGTTVRIMLPVVNRSVAFKEPYSPPASSPRGHERVMIVDDEEAITKLAKLALESRGFKVEAFNDVAKALEAAADESNTYDVAIVDYTMPGKTGLELARDFETLIPELSVILATGFLDLTKIESQKPSNIVDILRKPFDTQALIAAVNKTL